ncbi:MAG: squalene/phytoene synthase family protein, partial [Gluconacetobacter diazotrophicus]|nr:squalene/phytoene synthase family protein [Gluconacetobacter diazotrophicus]
GRLYLPREGLDGFAIPREPRAALHSPALPALCRTVAAEAQGHFDAARGAMRHCDRRAMRPARLMAASYQAVLSTLKRDGWRHPEQRLSVPAWRKAMVAARAVLPV